MGANGPYDRNDLVPKICERLAAGETLTAICKDIGISRRVVSLWRQADEEIAKQLKQAREDFNETHLDACLEISDNTSTDKGAVMRDKLRIWTRMQLIARSDNGSSAHKNKDDKAQSDTIVIFGGARDE